jgi:hypothetical protein
LTQEEKNRGNGAEQVLATGSKTGKYEQRLCIPNAQEVTNASLQVQKRMAS